MEHTLEKQYETPSLVDYGDLTELTQAQVCGIEEDGGDKTTLFHHSPSPGCP